MWVGATEVSHPSRLLTCCHLQPAHRLPLSTPWLPSPSVRATRVSASEVCGKSIMNTKRLERGLSERQLSVFVNSWGPSVPPWNCGESQLLLPEKLHPSVTCGPIYQIFTQSQLGPNTTLREDKTQSSRTEPVSTLVSQLLGGDNMSQAEATGGDFQTTK